MRPEMYLIMADFTDPTLEYGEALYQNSAVARNFKKAYELALSMGEIMDPHIGYKQALNRCQNELAVQLKCTTGSGRASISRIKKW
jgi:hypothetical protein